jgi:DNA-binding beta-propeller fold protein YncE
MLLASAVAYASLGFLSFPPGEEIGAMSAVAIGKNQEVYVLHRGPAPLMKFDPEGKFIKSWGKGLFELPHGLRVAPDGSVWTTDNKKNVLMKFSPDGDLLKTIVGGFHAPDDLVFTSKSEIVVADAGSGRLVMLSAAGDVIRAWGKKGKEPGEFAAAHGLAIDSQDRIYVADRGNHRVQVFSPDGALAAVWTGFGNPFGLLVVGGELVVTDGDAHKITQLSLDGKVLNQWGDAASLQLPHLMAVDSQGRLYVTEVNGKRVQIFKQR